MTSINCNGQTVLFSYAMALENSKVQGFMTEDGTKNEKILKPK
jgi:hypothetical protein